MENNEVRTSVPWRWRLVGLLRSLPEFRGRDRLGRLIRGESTPPAGVHSGSFGPGLRYQVRYQDDGSFCELFFMQYEDAALVPVLRTFLAEGGRFFDIGANIGVYTGWAAKLVGSSGSVHAFEPVDWTRDQLLEFIGRNALENVTVIPKAVGSASGSIRLFLEPKASGLASAVRSVSAEASEVSVPMTSIDEYVAASGVSAPDLVKIDVEGYELPVIQGARELLSTERPPAVLFESEAEHLREAGVGFSEIVRWFEEEVGFSVYGLTPAGLVRVARGARVPVSTNSLALRPETHAAAYDALRGYRFRRNQTT